MSFCPAGAEHIKHFLCPILYLLTLYLTFDRAKKPLLTWTGRRRERTSTCWPCWPCLAPKWDWSMAMPTAGRVRSVLSIGAWRERLGAWICICNELLSHSIEHEPAPRWQPHLSRLCDYAWNTTTRTGQAVEINRASSQKNQFGLNFAPPQFSAPFISPCLSWLPLASEPWIIAQWNKNGIVAKSAKSWKPLSFVGRSSLQLLPKVAPALLQPRMRVDALSATRKVEQFKVKQTLDKTE